jgi:hypothetical protein
VEHAPPTDQIGLRQGLKIADHYPNGSDIDAGMFASAG